MRNKSSGKILTAFAVIIGILLLSSTAVSVFYMQKERDERKEIEAEFEMTKLNFASQETELKEIIKENFLFQEKNKEADERINSLLDDLELEQGIREEIKLESSALKEEIENARKTIADLKNQVTKDVADYERKIADLEIKINTEQDARGQAAGDNTDYVERNKMLEENIELLEEGYEEQSTLMGEITKTVKDDLGLGDIAAFKKKSPDGRILSVDVDTEFVIVNLGEKDGISEGTIMSVYRGKEYLGDVRVTRIQPELSAADLIPPFSSRLVRKNDQVVVKP